MPGTINLPLAGGAALVACALGIGLGTSTIDAVNPAFYRGPAVHPRERGAALDPREIEAERLARAAIAAEWPSDGRPARIACLGCAGRPAGVRVLAGAVPYFGSAAELRAREAREQRAIDQRFEARMAAMAARGAREDDVLRYQGMGGPEVEEALVEPTIEAEPIEAEAVDAEPIEARPMEDPAAAS